MSRSLAAAVTVRLLAAGFCFALAACSVGQMVTVTHKPSTLVPAPDGFRAGAAEVDITPPPGLPLFGHSWEGAAHARGYWTMLMARAIVFEDRRGKRFAVVQLDLGASSSLLHREVALRLSSPPTDVGIDPSRLMLLASHTHAGPGGYFGARYFNLFGAGRSGYDRQVVDFLADRIARSVAVAFDDLRPAVVSAGEVALADFSRNRSREAWCRNFPNCCQAPYNGVRPLIRVLRIDTRSEGDVGYAPRAALVLVPAHATAVDAENKLYHGDLHGVVARIVRARVETQSDVVGFVAAVAAGAEGDVSPAWNLQSIEEAKRLGTHVGNTASEVFLTTSEFAATEIDSNYVEESLPSAPATSGSTCQRAVVGVPVMAGAEDGPSRLRGWLGVREGRVRNKPKGCHGFKVPALGFVQRWILRPRHFPQVAPVQILKLGDTFVLGTVPGEATTEMAFRLESEIRRGGARGKVVAVAGLGNEYASYLTTMEEYEAQHYEGGSTLYGPNTETFYRDRLREIAATAQENYSLERNYWPGASKPLLPRGDCPEPDWSAGEPAVICGDGIVQEVTFPWRSGRPLDACPLPWAKIECDGVDLAGRYDQPENSRWINFEVFRGSRGRWVARWTRQQGVRLGESCRITVGQSTARITSSAFSDNLCSVD